MYPEDYYLLLFVFIIVHLGIWSTALLGIRLKRPPSKHIKTITIIIFFLSYFLYFSYITYAIIIQKYPLDNYVLFKIIIIAALFGFGIYLLFFRKSFMRIELHRR